MAKQPCECGHPWTKHIQTPNGAHTCQHFGCGCRDVVRPPEGSYGFTCGYCETMLSTPFNDGEKASEFAHDLGWRYTLGQSPRWGEGYNITCPTCVNGDPDATPLHVKIRS